MDSLFRSARLKLTLFYLLILVGLSLTLTLGFRVLAEHEYARSSSAQYGQVRHLLVRYPWDTTSGPTMRPEIAFSHIQDNEESAARERLNRDFVFINLVALVAGGILSYLFAGRTLRPIEEAHAVQSRFAADASHELRTPLTSMKLENEVFLRQKHFSEAEARQQLHSNLEEVQRLEQLATGLLQLTNFDGHKLERRITKLKPIVMAVLERYKKQADDKQITVHTAITDNIKVLINGESIEQLLGVILDNALKYSPAQTTITVEGKQDNDYYQLAIRDQGPGIADEDLPRIFERLYRGDKARSSQVSGYGIGLALAQQIAQANHAVLSATNNIEGGACFTVRLPLVRSSQSGAS